VGPLVTSDVTLTGNTVHTNDATAFPLSDIYMAVDSQDPGHNTPTRIRGNISGNHVGSSPSSEGRSSSGTSFLTAAVARSSAP